MHRPVVQSSDWLILGGGLLGSAMAAYIARETSEKVLVVDPHQVPFQRWESWARNCGMTHMRSPASHSLHHRFQDLWNWSRRNGWDPERDFLAPNKRPPLKLFLDHARNIMEQAHWREFWIQNTAASVAAHKGGWRLTLQDGGEIHSSRILLSLGGRQSPNIPKALSWPGSPMHHIFTDNLPHPIPGKLHLVVGGGISAVQKMLSILQLGGRGILLTEGPLSAELYDHNPGYNGPKFRDKIAGEEDYARRVERIQENKWGGTVPGNLIDALEDYKRQGRLKLTSQAEEFNSDQASMVYRPSGEKIHLGYYCTGFQEKIPSHPLVSSLGEHLPTHQGYPILNTALEWAEGLHVMGAMAELELGPGAGNLIGFHLARRRLIQSGFLQGQKSPPI